MNFDHNLPHCKTNNMPRMQTMIYDMNKVGRGKRVERYGDMEMGNTGSNM